MSLFVLEKLKGHQMTDKPTYEKLEQRVLELEKEAYTLKQVEEALKESEERLTAFMESATDGFILFDSELNHIEMNKVALEITGLERKDVIGKNIIDTVPNIKETGRYDEYKKVMKIGVPFQIPDLISHPLTGDKHIELKAFKVGDGLGIIFTDVTKRKQAEEELQKIASVVKYSSELINLATLDGKMIFLNKAGSKMLGIDSDKVEQVHIMEVIPDDFQELVQTELLPALMEGDTWEGELKYRNIKTGEVTDVHAMTFTVKEPNTQKPLFLANVSIDITERKRAEEEKAKLEAQLQQAQKMESMGTLAGGIAHDFNNLLMGIQGRASLMQMDIDSSNPHFEHLKGIGDYVKSAAELTKQLLGFARGGKYEVKTTDLNKFIKKQNRMFGRTIKEITIRGRYEKNLWTVDVDQGQIEQALLNIYVNAWHAMPGGGALFIQTENVMIDEHYIKAYQVKPGKYVKISITDTGVGMDEATLQRIFDPFFTTKEMGRGTGLGLASAYGIIKNHDGFIDVYSEKGEGTTFNIYLPASEKEIIDEKELAVDILKGSETVLLVDDEDIIIAIGQDILKSLGYEVLPVRGGEEAVEVYKKNHDKIDMVILDMIMPDMGGRETYDRLKEINPDIKVLLSSGYSIDGQATEILERGCDDFIQKPFNITDLSQKIRKILDKD
jgi:PAS domain S-box-containing protein